MYCLEVCIPLLRYVVAIHEDHGDVPGIIECCTRAPLKPQDGAVIKGGGDFRQYVVCLLYTSDAADE